jgi:hypothetical protein
MHSRKALSFVCAFIGLASSAPTTTSAPPSDPTPSGVTPDRILAVHDAWIPTNISNSTVVPPAVANVSIILPPPVGTNSPDFTDLSSQAFNKSLPFLLEQLGVDAADIPDLVAEAIPLFNDIVIGSISGGNSSSADPSANLRRRGLFSKIGKWVKKVVNKAVNVVEDVASDAGCSVFAAGALPGYLVSADLFKVQNVFKIPSPTSSDQDFYIFPLHGPISHNDGIVVYYQANFPPGFGSADGVTMGRNIYLRGAKASVSTDAAFKSTTKILLHEFTHSKQYQSFGYNLNAFGLKYLFEYCKVIPLS